MCTALSLAYVPIFLAIGAGFVVAALCQGQFSRRLSEHHPLTWRELTQKKIFFDDGDQQGAIASRYFLSGAYKSLGDETLNSFAMRGWLALVMIALAHVAWFVVHSIDPSASLLACVWR
ncbi:MAG: hypothetical protein Q7U97_11315 [Rhodocyclaceae bacterium]|nr:hypothetical protein [Rhodocyclaceae bacterium]